MTFFHLYSTLYLVSLPPYLQAEVEAKTRKLRKLFTKLQTVKQEIVDVTEEYNRDRRDLEDTQQQLLKELKLKMLIIDNFISPSDKEKLMSRAAYDDETDLWILQPNAKGQLISECLFDVLNFPKKQQKI